jgi:tRNA(fMet)-specific endonuclease VapC
VTPNVVQADTNILSYIYNKRSFSVLYQPHLKNRIVVIAAQTVAEMRFGALRKNWGATRRATLESFLSDYTTVYPNDVICTLWAKVTAFAEFQGRHVTTDDAWIAATAMAMDIPLVTHNKKDFDFIEGLTVISEGG